MSTLHIDYTEKDCQNRILADFRISINMISTDSFSHDFLRKVASEACLASSDIISKKSIHVKKAMIKKLETDSNNDKKKWKRALGAVKTLSSNRVVPMDDVTVNQLKVWKQYLVDKGIMDVANKKGYGSFVFLDKNGEPQKYDRLIANYGHWLKRRELGFRATFHMFRHSYATWIRSKGGDPMVIKAFMGHSLQEDITEGVYTSITTELRDRTVDIINAFTQDIYYRAVEAGALIEPNGKNGKMKLK